MAEQNHVIDKQLLFFEELLEGLATATVQARMSGAPSIEPLYLTKDFRTSGQAPTDLTVASRPGQTDQYRISGVYSVG